MLYPSSPCGWMMQDCNGCGVLPEETFSPPWLPNRRASVPPQQSENWLRMLKKIFYRLSLFSNHQYILRGKQHFFHPNPSCLVPLGGARECSFLRGRQMLTPQRFADGVPLCDPIIRCLAHEQKAAQRREDLLSWVLLRHFGTHFGSIGTQTIPCPWRWSQEFGQLIGGLSLG